MLAPSRVRIPGAAPDGARERRPPAQHRGVPRNQKFSVFLSDKGHYRAARQIRQPVVRDDGHAALEYSGDAARPAEDRRIGRVLIQQDRVELIAGRYPAQPGRVAKFPPIG
jgi:hypothetical protein